MRTRDEIIQELISLKAELAENYGVHKIGLFGSYAYGNANSNSDLDLIIEFVENQPDIYNIKRELRALLETKFGLKVDLAREKYLKPYFREDILKQVIYV